MKLKKRFKKALFSFFKDEILDSVGHQHPTQHVEIKRSEVDFKEICSEIVISEDHINTPLNYAYEISMDRCKEELFNEAMKHVVINQESVFNRMYSNDRRIKVSLFIGTIKS